MTFPEREERKNIRRCQLYKEAMQVGRVNVMRVTSWLLIHILSNRIHLKFVISLFTVFINKANIDYFLKRSKSIELPSMWTLLFPAWRQPKQMGED